MDKMDAINKIDTMDTMEKMVTLEKWTLRYGTILKTLYKLDTKRKWTIWTKCILIDYWSHAIKAFVNGILRSGRRKSELAYSGCLTHFPWPPKQSLS